MSRDKFAARAKAVALEEYVNQVVAAAPPLTDQQRNQLAELLRPVRRMSQAHVKAAAA
jgi:hypothetical protein